MFLIDIRSIFENNLGRFIQRFLIFFFLFAIMGADKIWQGGKWEGGGVRNYWSDLVYMEMENELVSQYYGLRSEII